jgi:ubiquitin conjugation factor E4 B
VPYLLHEVESENGLCMDFIMEAVARLDEDDTIAPLFTKAMADISTKLATMSMNDDYKPCVNVSSIAWWTGRPLPFSPVADLC